MRLAVFVIALGILLPSSAAASDPTGKAVYLDENEIYSVDTAGHVRQLTSDGVRKWLPVWSQDGQRIAFMREAPKHDSLGDLIVMSESGEKLTEIHVDPADPKEKRQMPYVDSLQWISPDRVAAGGADIYSYEVDVFDIKTGEEVDETNSQEIDVVFSPDGKHFASFMGMAHFTPEEDREPEMDIDNKRVYPPEHGKVSFLKLNEPVWSQDSSKLAIAAKDEKANKFVLVIWRTDGPLVTLPLPVSWDQIEADLFWQDNKLLVQARKCIEQPMGQDVIGWDCKVGALAWKLSDDVKTLVKIPTETYSNAMETQARAEQEDENAILLQVKKVGGSYADWWCKSCALAKLPREASSY